MLHGNVPTPAPSAPSQSFPLLRHLLPRRLQPWVRGVRKRWRWRSRRLEEPFASVLPFTQVSLNRQRSLYALCSQVEAEGVAGAVVECGVLDGGTAALMASATQRSSRPVHLFDAWQGLPPPSEEDGEEAAIWEKQVVGSPIRVRAIMRKLAIDPARVHFHQGWFADTFPCADIDSIAVLHIDCDFYEPTKLCLKRWAPCLTEGGVVQLDDYHAFTGCRLAVDEFLSEHPSVQLCIPDHPSGAVWFRVPAGWHA